MPIKILFLTHNFYPDIGGTEANALFLAKSFYDFGAEVHLVTWTKDIGDIGFPFTVIRNPGIKTLFKEHQWADVVFENNPCLRLSFPNLIFRKPLVVALNTWLNVINGKKNIRSQVKYRWLKRAATVIAVSDAVRNYCWKEACVIENAYNSNLFTKLTNIHRNKAFIFLGRLVSDKGADLAIQAIYQLQFSRKTISDFSCDLSLTIVGDGRELSSLKKLVSDLKIENLVSFEGSLSGNDLVKCLNRHKYLIVPSVWEEPFGIVALEGMACGCIPIVSNGGGLPDAVGKAGVIFERGNVESLVDCINSLIDNSTLEENMRIAAFQHLKMHTPEIISQKYFEIIKSAILLTKQSQ